MTPLIVWIILAVISIFSIFALLAFIADIVGSLFDGADARCPIHNALSCCCMSSAAPFAATRDMSFSDALDYKPVGGAYH